MLQPYAHIKYVCYVVFMRITDIFCIFCLLHCQSDGGVAELLAASSVKLCKSVVDHRGAQIASLREESSDESTVISSQTSTLTRDQGLSLLLELSLSTKPRDWHRRTSPKWPILFVHSTFLLVGLCRQVSSRMVHPGFWEGHIVETVAPILTTNYSSWVVQICDRQIQDGRWTPS